MKRFLPLALYSLLSISAAQAAWLPNIKFYSNKLVDAWDNNTYSEDINQYPAEEDIIILKDKSYEEVAKWRPRQLGFYYRHMKGLLETGIDPRKGILTKALGGIGFLTGYDFKVDPAFYEGYYTRVDSFSVKPSFSLTKTFLKKEDYLLQSKLSPGYELEYTFYRHYKDPRVALTTKPYFHQNLPFDSEHAKKGMKSGDIFRFKTKLTMLLSTDMVSRILKSPLEAKAGAFLEASGLYDVFIIRHPDNVAQLRVMGGKLHKFGLKAQAGVDYFFVNEGVMASIEKAFNNGFIFDYLVNLNDPKVAKAFDESLLKVREFEYMGMVDPRDFNGKEFKLDLSLNFAPLEKLIKAGNTNIVAEFQGDNRSSGSRFKIGFGTESSLLSLVHESQNFKNDFLNEDKNYILSTSKKENSFSFLFALSEIKTINRTSSLLSDENGKSQPLAVVFSTERIDRRFSQNDLKKSLKEIKRLFPYAYPKLDLSNVEGLDLGAVGIRTMGIFTTSAIKALPVLSKKKIALRYEKHLSNLDITDLIYRQGYRNGMTPEELFKRRLSQISAKLEDVMNPRMDIKKRVDLLTKLNGQPIFKATGMGFLVSLLTERERKTLTRTEIAISSLLGPRLHYIEGEKGPRSLYSQLIQYDNLLNGSELELRLLLDSLIFEE